MPCPYVPNIARPRRLRAAAAGILGRARGLLTARLSRDFRGPLRPPKRDFGTSWPAKAEVAPSVGFVRRGGLFLLRS